MAACDDELSDTVMNIVGPSLLQSPLSSSDFSSPAVIVLSPLVLRLRRRRLSQRRLECCCVTGNVGSHTWQAGWHGWTEQEKAQTYLM
jgi:hypothetical protein